MDYDILFTSRIGYSTQTLRGKAITWDELPNVARDMGGTVDEYYDKTKFVEIDKFNAVFIESDFDFEDIYALDNRMILTDGELKEKGFKRD